MEERTDKVFVTNKDYISTLPEPIIHEILSRFTMLDVARASCLSNAWKNFCASLPYLNIDQQDFDHLPYDRFKNFMSNKVRSMSMIEERLAIQKFRLRMSNEYVEDATEEIENCTRLVFKTSTIKEFDFQIMCPGCYGITDYWYELFDDIYNAKTLLVLRLGGLNMIEPSNRDVKLSHLEILSLEKVKLRKESDIGWIFTSCPMIREMTLIECGGLEHLKVCGNCGNLKLLEVSFCDMLKSVEIEAPSLEKLVLSEIKRTIREAGFHMTLSIDSTTSESLRELTLRYSSMLGLTFSRLFSRCSNVESLELVSCIQFYKIRIASQKLRKLVIKICSNLLVTDIEAPNLTSFSFCNCVPEPCGYYGEGCRLQDYCDEISQLQECMIDYNQLLRSKNVWISLWFDKFKDSAGQKMVIYPNPENNWLYDVVILEDWSSMAEISLMSEISEAAKRTIITTMSFGDLANYVFGDWGKNLENVLVITSTDESMLYEALKKKPQISCQNFSSGVITKENKDEVSSVMCSPSFSRISATLTETSFSVIDVNVRRGG